ncbi:hypothetical protein MLD38_035116 [Melastoma candidum]|uniref:Uncharacterized protein n=1 Tax=Melastoma candidum TaxID=119954 RepID=A0ACB9MCS1_9MYRT|nr:hypothetical protein MLD38_035116 [Melastoma candidum]
MWRRRTRSATRSNPQPKPQQSDGNNAQAAGQQGAEQSRPGYKTRSAGPADGQTSRGDGSSKGASEPKPHDLRQEKQPWQTDDVALTEEEKEREYERFARYWKHKLAEELKMRDPDRVDPGESSDPGEKKDSGNPDPGNQEDVEEVEDPKDSSPDFTNRLQEDFTGQEQDLDISTESDSSDSDMEVGMASYLCMVWMRKPDWVRFPKPDYMKDYMKGSKENVTSASRDLIAKPQTLKRKIRDWFVQKEKNRMKMEKAARRRRYQRAVMVADKGIQTEKGRFEEGNTKKQDFGKGIEDQGREIEETVNQEEELSIAEGVIILGWKENVDAEGKDMDCIEGNTHFSGQPSSKMAEGPQSYDYPAQDTDFDPLRVLLDRVMDGFADLDADQKLIQCQAMKFIIENIGSPSEETTRLLDFTTGLVRRGVHQKFTALYDVSSGESKEEQDRIELQAKESIRRQFEQEATQQKLEEELLGMLWRLEIAGPSTSVRASRTVSEDDLKKCFVSWKSATNLKRDLLREQLTNLEKEMELMSVKVQRSSSQFFEEHCEGLNTPGVAQKTVLKQHSEALDLPASAGAPQNLPDESDKQVEDIPVANEGITVRRVLSGPDGQPLGAPRSPGPDSRLNSIIALIYDKIEDPVGRPRALDQHEHRSIMRDLWHIRNESNRAAKRNKCRALRDHLLQLEGPGYIF